MSQILGLDLDKVSSCFTAFTAKACTAMSNSAVVINKSFAEAMKAMNQATIATVSAVKKGVAFSGSKCSQHPQVTKAAIAALALVSAAYIFRDRLPQMKLTK
jgi:hypothetical protein